MGFDKCTEYLKAGLQDKEEIFSSIIMNQWMLIKPFMERGLERVQSQSKEKEIDFMKNEKGYEKTKEISEFRGKSAVEYFTMLTDYKKKTGKSVYSIWEAADVLGLDIHNAGKEFYDFEKMLKAISVGTVSVPNKTGKCYDYFKF